jgi:hypothetical protein
MNETDRIRLEEFRQFRKEVRGSAEYLLVGIDEPIRGQIFILDNLVSTHDCPVPRLGSKDRKHTQNLSSRQGAKKQGTRHGKKHHTHAKTQRTQRSS